MKIAIDKIIISKDNPRQSFDEEGLRRLGESIKEHGQLQSIIVRPRGSAYELVVGERRLRASKLIGVTEIEATVQDLDDATCDEFRLIENTHREDLTEAEKGSAIAHLLRDYPEKYPTLDALATKLAKSYSTVKIWFFKSEKLSATVKKLVGTNQLFDHIATELLRFDCATQNKLALAIIKYKIKPKSERLHREFIKQYELNSEKYPTVESLEDLANEVKGVKTVKIDLDKLSSKARAEVERKLAEAKKEATAIRKTQIAKPRTNHRKQGRPRKDKKTSEPEETFTPKPTIDPIIKVVPVAINFPESLWETVLRYTETTDKPMLVEEAVISLLESHPLLKGM